mmetsp:Transcript_27195/g.62744  ORF Transcript_27195/g.62744 Transcript_27195/m.62744 type:complete len:253 (-) Transcript_27195:110-868(-)
MSGGLSFARIMAATDVREPKDAPSSSSTDCVTILEFCNRCRQRISSASRSGNLASAYRTSCSAAARSASRSARMRSRRCAFSVFAFKLASSFARWTATARSEFVSFVSVSVIRFCRRTSCENCRCCSAATCLACSCFCSVRSRTCMFACFWKVALFLFCCSVKSRACAIDLLVNLFSKALALPSSMVAAWRLTSSRSRHIFSSSRWKKRILFSIALRLLSTALRTLRASCTVIFPDERGRSMASGSKGKSCA